MRTVITGLAILAFLFGAVNLQAQSVEATSAATRASLLGGSEAPPPMPGPPPNASAEFLLAEGEALLAAGYLDAALQDFQQVVNMAADTSPLVAKAWYGLARVYMAQGNLEFAKTSLEEVLTLNTDSASSMAARAQYATLKSQQDQQLVSLQQQFLFFQWRYHSTPFFNFITKFFAWKDMQNAEKALKDAQSRAATFNPRYLIAPVGGSAMASETGGVTPEEMQAVIDATSGQQQGSGEATYTEVQGVHTPAPGETAGSPAASVTASASATGSTTGSAASQERPSETASGSPSTPEQPAASITAAPMDALAAKRQSYLSAYNNLQAAMGSGDAAAIRAATTAFQEATRAYNAARQAVTGQ